MRLCELHNRPKAAVLAPCFGERIGVARLSKVKFPETCLRAKLAVLWALERRGAGRFGEGIRVEGRYTIHVRVMDGDPPGLKDLAIRMQVQDILGQNIGINLTGMEHDGLARLRQGDDLQGLQLAFLEVPWVFGHKAVEETVRLPGVRQV